MKCYYHKQEHCIKDCNKFAKDKAEYKLKTANLAKKYKSKFRQLGKIGSISVNKISSALGLTYQVDQAEKLLGTLRLSNSNSE